MQIVRTHPIAFDDITIDITEDDAPDWLVGTTYDLNDEVIRDHKIYVSAIASNTGNDPLLENQTLSSARWIFKSHTNAFKFVDGTIGNATEGTTSVTIELANLSNVNALVIFGLQGFSLSVEGRSAADAVLYTHSQNISGREVYNYYDWYFGEFEETVDRVALTELDNRVATATITVTGTNIRIGEVAVGEIAQIGRALADGTSGEVISYTRTEFNSYGLLQNVRGPTRTEMKYAVHVTRARFDAVKRIMDKLQGQLVAAIGSPSRRSTIQLGILGTIRWNESLPNDYLIEFSVRGVI